MKCKNHIGTASMLLSLLLVGGAWAAGGDPQDPLEAAALLAQDLTGELQRALRARGSGSDPLSGLGLKTEGAPCACRPDGSAWLEQARQILEQGYDSVSIYRTQNFRQFTPRLLSNETQRMECVNRRMYGALRAAQPLVPPQHPAHGIIRDAIRWADHTVYGDDEAPNDRISWDKTALYQFLTDRLIAARDTINPKRSHR